MQQLIICKGLPGSGKSTFAKAWVLEDPKHRVRVCRDDIRRMLGPYWIPTREDLVTRIERNSVMNALYHDFNVILDATNFKIKYTKQGDIEGSDIFIPSNYSKGVEITIKDFTDVSIEECIKRDGLRTGTEKVGEAVIRQMYERYLKHSE